MAQLPAVARQAMPRFDLYAELGIPPTADTGSIEAAYRSIIVRWDPDGEAGGGNRRIVRARRAREWLTDPERRSRYDASRARAAARASGTSTPRRRTPKAGLAAEDAAAAEAEAAAEARAAAEGPESTVRAIAWPTADLARSRPAGPTPRARSRRRDRVPIGAVVVPAGLLIVVVGVLAVMLSTRPAPTDVAVGNPTHSPSPVRTLAVATTNPTSAPTVPVTAPPPTDASIDMAPFQEAAWQTIQSLSAAAAAGDVEAAQALLGDTAPDLRASGLRRATFPNVPVADIAVQREGDLYTALAGTDRLTSTDGTAWTFDYGERPLAVYRSPTGEAVHDLYWLENDGKHDIYLRVALVTLSKSGVTAKVTWSYDPSRPDDATYFRKAQLVISSAALDGGPIPVTGTALPMVGVTTLTPTATLNGAATVPAQLAIGITVTNPRSSDGSDRAIESVFNLLVR